MRRLWLGIGLAIVLPTAAGADIPPPKPVPPIVVPNAPTTTQYDPNRGFPDQNGPLSAMMVVIPQAELSEFDKADSGSRRVSKVTRAEPGAVLAVKFLFMGLMPDWNGNANVSFDLQVLAPDGTIYSGSDYRNLDALHARVADDSSEGVYDNRGKIVLMQFEDQDVPGLYTLKGTLHDNVAKRDIPLLATVELLAKPKAPILPDEAKATPSVDEAAKLAPPVTATKSKTKKRRRRHR